MNRLFFTQMKPELMMLPKKLEPSWKQRESLQSGIHDIKAPHIPILKSVKNNTCFV